MQFLKLFLVSCLALTATAATSTESQNRAQALLNEYISLKELTLRTTPDGLLGGLYHFKLFADHQLLWDKNDYLVDGHDTLRIYIGRSSPLRDFSITYHYSDFLLDGRTTLRRFLGPEIAGWRADTLDVNTLELFPFQGIEKPRLNENEELVLRHYSIDL